jgi:hypothetical protein
VREVALQLLQLLLEHAAPLLPLLPRDLVGATPLRLCGTLRLLPHPLLLQTLLTLRLLREEFILRRTTSDRDAQMTAATASLSSGSSSQQRHPATHHHHHHNNNHTNNNNNDDDDNNNNDDDDNNNAPAVDVVSHHAPRPLLLTQRRPDRHQATSSCRGPLRSQRHCRGEQPVSCLPTRRHRLETATGSSAAASPAGC